MGFQLARNRRSDTSSDADVSLPPPHGTLDRLSAPGPVEASAVATPPAVLESSLELALEIGREGREGRRIGTLFTVGKADEVLAASRALILDPLAGHAPARTHISDPDLRGTMKEGAT